MSIFTPFFVVGFFIWLSREFFFPPLFVLKVTITLLSSCCWFVCLGFLFENHFHLAFILVSVAQSALGYYITTSLPSPSDQGRQRASELVATSVFVAVPQTENRTLPAPFSPPLTDNQTNAEVAQILKPQTTSCSRAPPWILRDARHGPVRPMPTWIQQSTVTTCAKPRSLGFHTLQLRRLWIWPDHTPVARKLYGSLRDLRCTATFIGETGISIWRTRRRRR